MRRLVHYLDVIQNPRCTIFYGWMDCILAITNVCNNNC